MRTVFLFVFFLLVPIARAEDEATRLKLVEYMLKTPPDLADPKLVAPFMKLDVDTLPAKLRDKARAKQLQIAAIVKIHAGSKKGPFRYPAACAPKRYGPEGVKIMALIGGNEEVREDEIDYVERTANCTEDQLICEFSLNVVVIPRKGRPPLKRYYLMNNDPIFAFIAEYRNQGKAGRTNYFGELKPTCQKLATP